MTKDVLVAAAWLHDVGYAPGITASGLHALDGASCLRRQGFEERVTNLVAYHSYAVRGGGARHGRRVAGGVCR
ncbi:HD domain-containing protein [Micromonospora sp. BL4]|uniref:HD domain-containing protein n=1 Tax=Micromonospora sp. BL4 TaxID=2478710 RepID=UPI0018F4DEDC